MATQLKTCKYCGKVFTPNSKQHAKHEKTCKSRQQAQPHRGRSYFTPVKIKEIQGLPPWLNPQPRKPQPQKHRR